jgi:hypothetical protein
MKKKMLKPIEESLDKLHLKRKSECPINVDETFHTLQVQCIIHDDCC